MTCPKCGADSINDLQLCKSCIDTAAKERLENLNRWKPAKIKSEKPYFLSIEFLRWPIFALLIAFIVARQMGVFGYGTLAKVNLPKGKNISQNDSCDGKERCIVYFMAPWCPTCQGAVPFINDMRARVNRTSKVGMKIVVGSDALPSLESFAQKLDGPVYYDADGEFAYAMSVSSIPAILVLDDNRKILRRNFPAALAGGMSPDELFNYYNENYLKLTEYF